MALLLSLFTLGSWAAKTVYIPSTWVYNSSTQEYTEGGNSDLQWSYNRSKQSDNCIVFWQKGFGTNPKTGSLTFDPDAVLSVAEQCYAKNVTTLGFSCSNMLNKYKLMILVNYTTDWVCYGGGYDFEVSALWIAPSAVSPAGHSLAHEVGHSFHYMCYAEAANYSHTSSSSINTGFHLACGNGQAIWEQTAQWQANQSYPAEMFSQSYPLFGNNANYAFSHEWMRYQSYWFHYYLCEHYNDLTTVAQVWKQPMTGQSNGNATDFCQALMAKKSLSASQFYALYFDYAMKCATFDFTAAASYRDNYIGNFDYYAVQLDTKKYQVAYASAPQSTGFNVIELTVPSSGTTITTKFTALQHGCALADADPGQYNNGNANSLVNANVSNYNSAGTASDRGFRVGYVFLKSDGTRSYYNDNTVHCTGTAEVTENISTTVPANTSRIFLVVTPALTTYVKHAWDDNILNDDQWPYSFELVNTDLKTASVYTEPIPEEPVFTKVLDGRSIANVTLTYNVIIPPSSSEYSGTAVILNTGNAVNALCTAFQLESSNIFGHVIDYTASQGNGTIMSCALNSSGGVQASGKNTNGTFGHWFNSAGTVVNWGNNSVVYTEFDANYANVSIGQYPGLNSNGTTRTIREGLVYKDVNGNTAKAMFVYNVTFKTGAAPTAYLSAIDYTAPADATTPVKEQLTSNGFTQITALPADYSPYFFVLYDHDQDLTMVPKTGVHQESTYMGMWYDADLNPMTSKEPLWTLDAFEQDNTTYQIVTNATIPDYMFQTEYNKAYFYRTHDNGGGGTGWGRTLYAYDSSNSYWTIQNGVYPQNGYLGPWDAAAFADDAETALNKTEATEVGHFDVFTILRGDYVKRFDAWNDATYDSPLDITYVLENPGGERRTTIGWKSTGTNWQGQGNSPAGKVGGYYLECYNGSGVGSSDFYQEISGLPDGYYRFSARGLVRDGGDQGFSIYANSESTKVTSPNLSARFNVIVQVLDGNLRVGAKAESVTKDWIAIDDAKLEYLGLSIPSYNVGTPTSDIADGSYIQDLSTWTLNFTEATSNVEGAVFSILDNSKKASLFKDATKVGDYTLNLSGKTVSVTFSGVTLDTESTYHIDFPAGAVGYAGQVSNEAVSITFHTPVVFDGTYYLYNTYTENYMSRGIQYGTGAIVDDWGLAINVVTNTQGQTMLRYFDSQQYLYASAGWCFGDGNEGGSLKFTMSKTGTNYKFLKANSNEYLAVYYGRIVNDAREGDNLVGTSNVWTLEPTADHVANYTRCADTQAATAATAASISGITTKAALDSYVNTSTDTDDVAITGYKAERYQWYASNANPTVESEYYKETVTGLTPGLYRLSVDAFQRAAWFEDVAAADGARGLIYVYANDAKTQVKSVMEYGSTTAFDASTDYQSGGFYYANREWSGYDALSTGNYQNVVYVYVPADDGQTTGTLTFGINNPNRLGQQDENRGTWCMYQNFRLERVVPSITLSETDGTAPARATHVNVTLNRTISANTWNTVCFPFAMTSAQIKTAFGNNTVVKQLSGATPNDENITLTFQAVDDIAANTPYILKTDAGGTQYTINDIDVTPSKDLTFDEVDGIQFIGNYIYPFTLANDGGTDFYIKDNMFYSSPGATKLKGFRAYFHVPNSSNGNQVKALLSNFDDNATDIRLLDDDCQPTDVYTPSGILIRSRATSLEGLPRGTYITGGKKVQIK